MPRDAIWYCEQCNYELAGLPPQGQCPECGHPYDTKARKGVRDSAHAQRRVDRIMRLVGSSVYFMLAVCVMICAGLLSFVARTPNKPLIVGGIIAGILVLGGVVSLLRDKDS